MKIAILEDNPRMMSMLQLYLANTRYDMHFFQSAKAFLDFFAISTIDLLITDYRLMSEHEKSGMTGADVIRHIREERPRLPAIVISAAPMFELEEVCRDISGVRIMQKPLKMSVLIEAIQVFNT